MKGTRARLLDPIADAEARRELAVSEKDRAENVMIVDLMRNDIGRVCELGSVVVPVLYEVETYATVHQLTSTVVGTLRPGVGVFELLEAVFPPGSMTGAPKVAACTLLAEVESRARGLYAGTVGWIGYDGRAEFSVVIRTLQAWGDVVRWDVGGGVVWDSTPEGEWAEAMHKADALRRAGLV
jgi:anthranilate/para-aminobenzoate synthase component I